MRLFLPGTRFRALYAYHGKGTRKRSPADGTPALENLLPDTRHPDRAWN